MNKIYLLLLLFAISCNASKDKQVSNAATANDIDGINVKLNPPENTLFKYAITNITKTDFLPLLAH
jgi:hypothetical protein